MQSHHTNTNSQSSNIDILNEAASKGFGLNLNDFFKFANMVKDRNPEAIVQELLDSGQITQEQLESLKTKAQGFIGLMNFIKPSN